MARNLSENWLEGLFVVRLVGEEVGILFFVSTMSIGNAFRQDDIWCNFFKRAFLLGFINDEHPLLAQFLDALLGF